MGRRQNHYHREQILKRRKMANDNKPNPNKIKVSPWLIYGGIVILLSVIISYATGGSNFQELAKTGTSKFNDTLDKGDVQKVIVYNNKEAEVYLTEVALKTT